MVDDDLAFDPTALRYIELIGDGNKNPAKAWGGYSQDFEDADRVYSHEDVEMHPADSWGVVDCADSENNTLSLLIFDVDSYKAPDDFDQNRVEVPADTLVTKSQSGGLHVYYKVRGPRGHLSESDFAVHEDLPFDIDIRGSSVSQHVVAPNDIPGVGGDYKIVNDERITLAADAAAAARSIKFDGKPAVTYSEQTRADIDFDRPAEPPEDMPECYHAGLSLRAAAPDDPDLNTHKVNFLTALCGLAAGYDVEEVASHMCGEYSPQDGDTDLSDKEETQYQVEQIEGMLEAGQYSPPALSTLRDYGILGEDESCGDSCPIDLHSIGTSTGDSDTGGDGDNWAQDWSDPDWEDIQSARLNVNYSRGNTAVTARKAVESWEWSYDDDGEPDEIVGLNVVEPITETETVTATLWLSPDASQNEAYQDHIGAASETVERLKDSYARRVVNAEPLHKLTHRTGALYRDRLNPQARSAIAQRLIQAFDIVTVGGADDKTLYAYDPDTGAFDADGRELIRGVIETLAPERASDTEKREIISKVADRTREPASEAWEARGKFDAEADYRSVGNCVLKLPKEQEDGTVSDVERLDHSPDLRTREHLPVDYNPGVDTSTVEEWLEDITAREEDARTLEEIVGNVLTTDYRHPYITVLHGPGRNSKGTFLDVIAELAGGAESSNVAGNRLEDLAKNNFRTGMLDQAVVNINGDIAGKKIKQQHGSKLKELSGEEVQEGESKFTDAETFRNTAKFVFATNNNPLPPGTKTSWAERWLPLELPFQYVSDPDPSDPMQKEADNTIKTRLTRDENLEAMLLLAVDGLKRLEENQDVSLPESPEERLETYQKNADPIGETDAELIEESPDPGASLPKEAVYAAYKSLARDNGDDPVETGQFWQLFKPRSTVPINESRPSYEGDRVRVLKGVQFTEAAREHLSDHWLQHDWVNLDPETSETVNDAENAVETVSLAGIPDKSGYVNVEVNVVAKTQLNENVVEITVHDGDAMRDIVVKDRGNDELDVADSVRTGDTVLFERVKPGADLKVRKVTEVSVIEQGPVTDDDGQTGLPKDDDDDNDGGNDDGGEVVNDSNDGSNIDTPTDEEAVTTDTPDASESQQDGVKADGGDSEEIDDAVLRNAEAADTTAALAGVVSHEVVGADLDKIKHRIEKLAGRGDIILDGDNDPEDGGSEREIPETIDAVDGTLIAKRVAAEILRDIRSRDDDDDLLEDVADVVDEGSVTATGGDRFAGRFDVERHGSNGTVVGAALNGLIDGGWLDEYHSDEAGCTGGE